MSTVPGTPGVYWWLVRGVGDALRYYWMNPGVQMGTQPVLGASPGPVAITHGDTLDFGVLVLGDPSGYYTFVGDVTVGSGQITNIPNSSASGLSFSQFIQSVPPGAISNGCQILSVTEGATTTVAFGGEGPGEAFVTQTGVSFTATDTQPEGYLVTTVTPSTGVSMVDYNFDGTQSTNNVGDGQMISNWSGQAEGLVRVTFADAGTFSVSVAFASLDPAYAGGTISPSITVEVS